MKLKMLVGLAGVDFSLSPNEETVRFSGDEADRLINAGYAVPADAEPIERAVRPRSSVEKRG